MNDEVSDLERLISRYLDDEATRAERRRLRAQCADPQVEALLDEHETIDREAGRAMRAAMGRTVFLPTVRNKWTPVWQVAGLAAAACIAALMWMYPHRPDVRNHRPDQRQTADVLQSKWFIDGVQPQQMPVRQRNWIIVPGSRPGEYMVIEVDRVRPRVRPARDF
jgi:hypothetical protein